MTTLLQSFRCQVCKKDLNQPGVVRSIWDRSCAECSQKQKVSKFYVEGVMQERPQKSSKLVLKPGEGHVLEEVKASQGTGGPGLKDDGGKLRWDLLPWKAAQGLIKVLTFGAKKYSPNGWRSVPDAKARYSAALMRHLYALNAGEKLDPESGLRHIDHLLCNAAFLAELED